MKYKKIIFIIHLIFWTIAISIRFLSYPDVAIDIQIFAILWDIFDFYVNFFILVPLILKKPTSSSFLLWFLVYAVFYFLIISSHSLFIGKYYLKDSNYTFDLYDIIKWTLITLPIYSSISTGTRLCLTWFNNVENNKRLDLEHTEQQINLLKSKLDIPFIQLVLTKMEEKAKFSPSSVQNDILEVSTILRYQLSSTKDDSVLIEEEIKILEIQRQLYLRYFQHELNIKSNYEGKFCIKPGMLLKCIHEYLKYNTHPSLVFIESKDSNCYLKLPTLHLNTEKFLTSILTIIKDTQPIIASGDHIQIKLNAS